MAQGSAGVRVLEYAGPGSGIASAYAGWLLARMGARVTRLVDGPQAAPAAAPSPLQLALEVLADGKGAQALPAGRAARDALLADADILLCDVPAALDALAGPRAQLATRLPRLVLGVASPLGIAGPYADEPASALDAQALSAVAWSLGDPRREPLSVPPGVLEHQSGAMLAAGCLLALSVRDEQGTGRVVDIGLADVLASYVAGNCRVYIHHGLKWHRNGARPSGSCGAYPFGILPCKDGQVCISGRTREEWQRLVQAMGNPAWAAEPRYQNLRAMGTQYPEEVDALVAPWFLQHTKAELEAIALKNNLIVAPLREFREVLQTQQFALRNFLQTASAGGSKVLAPALPFRVTAKREEGARDLACELLRTGAPTGQPLSRAGKPLAGLRVLDFGWVWSAPWVGTILAELGAQVIKVEHALRPDNLRLAGKVFRDGKLVEGPSKEMSPMYHQINHGKLGITLNVKDPRAVALARRLAAISDVAIENMSPGSLERSQLGFEQLRAINPKLVMLAMSAAGQFGPFAGMRAYAPTMSAFAGLESLVGYRGETPIGALNFAIGDPNASVHGLLALLAALRRARATGDGAYIDLSQVEALLGTVRPYLLAAQVDGRQPQPLGNGHPEIAPHGIYPAAGEDRWLTIVAVDDAQWQALKSVAGDAQWSRDTRYDTLAARLANAAQLDADIAAWSGTQERDALAARLRAAGVASTPVLSVEEQWRDPHYNARAMRHRVEIPVYGGEDLYRAPWRFSDFEPEITRCGPRLGEHNAYVFGELLQMPDAEIEALVAEGVIA
jgi:crotonobetainyl-CoA:carnitine CoA-transferase CaiB-like acyl-CoA transferase